MLHSRIKRVEEEYHHAVANILAYEIRDPRLEFASVTRVKISKDLREAVVYYSLLNDAEDAIQEAREALESAKGYIKRLLAAHIDLKRLPDPRFLLDTTTRDAFHIFKLMQEVHTDAPLEETQEAQESGEQD
ncbi:MAG TPA: 30S ribosome-binding factor RbfA [Candidatus Sumerlaeota bacterium]|nr:30S ribosome-binding factor RbfA [Candidatus Sumerlaeota bacterium]HPS00813.1 30S ribosome-binding factor RbfA [Candidatus Sumerlaeota bacterium]